MANLISWLRPAASKQDLQALFRLSLTGDCADDVIVRCVFKTALKSPLTEPEEVQLANLDARYQAGAKLLLANGTDALRAAQLKQDRDRAQAVAEDRPVPAAVDLVKEFWGNLDTGREVMRAASQEAAALFAAVVPRALADLEKLIEEEQGRDRKRAQELGMEPSDSAVVHGLRRVVARLKLEEKKIVAVPARMTAPMGLFRLFGHGPDLPPPPAPPKPEHPRTEVPQPIKSAPLAPLAERFKAKEAEKRRLAAEGKITLAKNP